MSNLETNIFPVANLGELSSKYRLYQIKGIGNDPEEYDPNIQILIKKLSYQLQSPVTVIRDKDEHFLVVHEDSPDPPSPYQLVRATAHFERAEGILTLDYNNLTAETQPIAVRFLQFALQGALRNHRELWQPGAGTPIFERKAAVEKEGISVYRGYAVRVVPLEATKLGVCVDVKFKYVSQVPVPMRISREDFRRFKGKRCVYHYGASWYEIELHDHTGLTVTQQMLPVDGKTVPLHQYILERAPKPFPKEVIDLPADSVAVTYMTQRGEGRTAAGALCYPVFDTSDPRIKRMHRETILAPALRRSHIHNFVKNQLGRIQFKNMGICIDSNPVIAPQKVFLPPDLEFGNNTILSVRGTKGATYVSPERLGGERLAALFNPKIGPYVRKALDQQYLILPKSVMDSYGPAFIKDLRAVIDGLYPQEIPYEPALITYNDLGPKTYQVQGRAILNAVVAANPKPGYGVVMIPETVDRRNREHDELAAMVMRELRDRDLYVSVIHTTVSKESYILPANSPPGSQYQQSNTAKRLKGYLRNVAITKVLLTNERWPFVLATPLHADLTIAIDVQLNTACFTLMGKKGADIRTVQKDSKQKERLDKRQVRQILLDLLREEAALGRQGVQSIVIQRDGRLFVTEMNGMKEAVETLKKEGVLDAKVSLNFVEIAKSSMASFRLFDLKSRPDGGHIIENPQIGTYYITHAKEAYLCSTGREFQHPGTTNPVHIRYVDGAMPFDHILEDIYAQTCLTWTRPEDCARDPITIKLADIRLREHAGGYDEDKLEYDEDDEEENDDE